MSPYYAYETGHGGTALVGKICDVDEMLENHRAVREKYR